MNRKPSTRLITTLTVLLIAIVGGISWKNHGDLTQLREERDSLVSLTIERKIDLEADVPLSSRTLKPKTVRDIDGIAKDFIAYAIEFKDYYRDREIQKLDQASRDRMIGQMDEMMNLNPNELKRLIDIISLEPNIPANTRTALLQFSINRLAESHPFEALSLVVGTPEMLAQLGGHSRRILEQHLSKLAVNQLDQTKSWLRKHAETMPPDLMESSAYFIARTVVQSNPMETFAIAKEFNKKPEGYFPHIFQNRPLTQEDRSEFLPALREVATGIKDETKRAKFLKKNMAALILGQKSHTAGFEESTAWIAQGHHTDEELEIIWNPAIKDLGYHIKHEETGKWILWLQDTFAPEKSKGRVDQLLERWQRRDAEAAASFAREHSLKR